MFLYLIHLNYLFGLTEIHLMKLPAVKRLFVNHAMATEPAEIARLKVLAGFEGLPDNSYIFAIDIVEVRMHAATLTEKFQIGIPKAFREALHLKAGQQFVFIARGDSIVMVPKRSLTEMRGSLAGSNPDNVRDRSDRF